MGWGRESRSGGGTGGDIYTKGQQSPAKSVAGKRNQARSRGGYPSTAVRSISSLFRWATVPNEIHGPANDATAHKSPHRWPSSWVSQLLESASASRGWEGQGTEAGPNTKERCLCVVSLAPGWGPSTRNPVASPSPKTTERKEWFQFGCPQKKRNIQHNYSHTRRTRTHVLRALR